MGRSRGGLTTKIHAFVDAEGRPVKIALTAGQAGDAPAAEQMPPLVAPGATLIADRAYDTNAIRDACAVRKAWTSIARFENVTPTELGDAIADGMLFGGAQVGPLGEGGLGGLDSGVTDIDAIPPSRPDTIVERRRRRRGGRSCAGGAASNPSVRELRFRDRNGRGQSACQFSRQLCARGSEGGDGSP